MFDECCVCKEYVPQLFNIGVKHGHCINLI